MTNPRNATTNARSGSRFYSWRNENYWSVTTIIGGGVPKPALLPWGIKSVAEGAVRERGVVAAMLAQCATPDECGRGEFCPQCDQAVRYLKGIPYAHRDRAADLGTYIHNAVEAYVLGKPFPKWPAVAKSRMSWFERFLVDYEPAYEATEASVYNRTQRYAGTLDAIVTVHGRKLILDTKSGKGVYPEVGLQLAAYRYAEFIGLPDGSEEAMRDVDGGVCLHLTDDGYELIEIRCDEDVFRAFLYAREVFRWQEELSKTVLMGVPVEAALQATLAAGGAVA